MKNIKTIEFRENSDLSATISRTTGIQRKLKFEDWVAKSPGDILLMENATVNDVQLKVQQPKFPFVLTLKRYNLVQENCTHRIWFKYLEISR